MLVDTTENEEMHTFNAKIVVQVVKGKSWIFCSGTVLYWIYITLTSKHLSENTSTRFKNGGIISESKQFKL